MSLRTSLRYMLLLSSAFGVGCSADTNESVDHTEAAYSGTILVFDKVSLDPGSVVHDCGNTADPTTDTGSGEYTLSVASLTSSRQSKLKGGIAAGTARLSVGIRESFTMTSAATGTTEYATNILLNGTVVKTCTGSGLEVAPSTVTEYPPCEYAPSTYDAKDVYTVLFASTATVTCDVGATTGQGGSASASLTTLAPGNWGKPAIMLIDPY